MGRSEKRKTILYKGVGTVSNQAPLLFIVVNSIQKPAPWRILPQLPECFLHFNLDFIFLDKPQVVTKFS